MDGNEDGGDVIAIVEIRTIKGEVVETIEVDYVDHINMKEYLNEIYLWVNAAARHEGIRL